MRNFEYGAYAPVTNSDLIAQQFRLAHSYQCALIMIERERRGAIDALYEAACPSAWVAWLRADEAAKAASDAFRLSRDTGGEKMQPDEEMRAEKRQERQLLQERLDTAREAQKVARQAWYDAKRAATPALRPQIEQINDATDEANKRAYNLASTVGLATGTRLKIREAVDRAKKAALKENSLPKFPRFDGSGELWVQLKIEWATREELPVEWSTQVDKLSTRLAARDGGRWRAVERDGNALWFLNKMGSRTNDRYCGDKLPRTEYAIGFTFADALKCDDTRLQIDVKEMPAWQSARGKDALQSREKVRWTCACGNRWSGGSAGSRCRCGAEATRGSLGQRALPQAEQGKKASSWMLAVLRLRIGSNENRKPIWGEWPVRLQRDHLPPEGAMMKWACVRSFKVGDRTKWRVLLTVDDEQPGFRVAGPSLAVNLGWRDTRDGGIRVAYAVGSDGRSEEVRVPEEFSRGVAKVDDLRSIRDKRLVAFLKDVREWVDDEDVHGDLPPWFVEDFERIETQVVDRERASGQRRVALFLRFWETHRFAGDTALFSATLAWVKRDRHLRFWECDARESLHRMRRDFYRVKAADWASQYAHIFVTDMDLRDFAEEPEADEGARTKGNEQRRLRVLACPSEFRQAIENACSTRGTCCPRKVERARRQVEEGACPVHAGVTDDMGPYKTQTCNACKIVFAFAARSDIEHTCRCGARWDQDENHARNLLASAEMVERRRGTLAPSETSTGEGARAKRGGRFQKSCSQVPAQVADREGEKR